MPFFGIHDETGRFVQANVYFDPPAGYADLLREQGHSVVTAKSNTILSPDEWYALNGRECERPIMPVDVSATTIRAGGNDAVVLRGCPRGCRYQVSTGGVTPWSGTLDGDELEIAMDVPCLFRITLELWPYRTFAVDIEAVA